MNEGLNLNLVLSGATLVSVAGLFIKMYLASKAQRIGPQPFEVRQIVEQVTEKLCNERHHGIESTHSNLFARMSAVEKQVATLEGVIGELKVQYKSIDEKLTTLLRRGH